MRTTASARIDWQRALSDWLEAPHKFAHLLGFTKLTPLHGQWIMDFLRIPPGGQYVLLAHRNSYKTTSGLVALVLLFLLYPEIRVLVVRKTDTLAAKVSLAIQKLFLHNRVLRLYFYSRFGLSSVETREWSQDKTVFAFKTRVTIEPSLATSGIGGSITGAHYDYVWCDDIVASEDRYSAAERERTKHFVYELANVIDPRGSRLYTGTPWHRDDAFSVLPPAKRYPIGTVTVPDIDDAWIAQTRALLPPSLWAANYELRFVEDYQPEFPPLQFTDAVPAGERVWYIDPAFGGADHTAVAEGLRCGDKYYVTWLFYKRQSIGDLYDYLQEEFWARGIKVVYYEENSAQRLIGAELRRRQIPCRGVRNVSNKYARIVGVLKAAWPRLYFARQLETTAPEALQEIRNYNEHAVHDDACDALAGLVSALQSGQVHSFEVTWL